MCIVAGFSVNHKIEITVVLSKATIKTGTSPLSELIYSLVFPYTRSFALMAGNNAN
jgi:hypothetical protein